MELIDADEIKKREHDIVLANGAKHRCFDTTTLFEIPTADAVEVVRCKECKWYNEENLFCRYWAVLYAHADTTPRYSPVDYCFRGIRKEGAEE